MATFKVFASLTIPYEIEVEAESEREAYILACTRDNDDFIECDDTGFNGNFTVHREGILREVD